MNKITVLIIFYLDSDYFWAIHVIEITVFAIYGQLSPLTDVIVIVIVSTAVAVMLTRLLSTSTLKISLFYPKEKQRKVDLGQSAKELAKVGDLVDCVKEET